MALPIDIHRLLEQHNDTDFDFFSYQLPAYWNGATPPDTMGQTFDILAQTGLLDATLASNLKKAVGFRNIAVHNYEAINWHIVHSIVTNVLGGQIEVKSTPGGGTQMLMRLPLVAPQRGGAEPSETH